jgi:hypothetical protein
MLLIQYTEMDLSILEHTIQDYILVRPSTMLQAPLTTHQSQLYSTNSDHGETEEMALHSIE